MNDTPIWQPDPSRADATLLADFIRAVNARHGMDIDDYAALHAWSIDDMASFWMAVWDFCGVIGTRGERVLSDADRMPGARFFPDATLNFAENLLRRRDDTDAIVFRAEDKAAATLTWRALHEQVSRTAQALTAAGVGPGDRVAGFMANTPDAVVAMLAASSVGATWASCSPDFGVQGVLDRFGQIEPVVLFACDGYFYNGREHDVLDKVRDVAAAMPSLRTTVIAPFLRPATGREPSAGDIPGAVLLDDFTAPFDAGDIAFRPLPFAHPLYILFSSGTTGVPKCIVHSAGGTLLQHLKEHRLHADVRPGDRLFYFTTCTWMMWNWLVSGLASEATLLLYDGSPAAPDALTLFDYADEAGMTHFGTSAKYLDGLNKQHLRPAQSHSLTHLRAVLSTGSPLSPAGFDYVYEHIGEDLFLASIAGGTDIVSCFVLGNPISPVYRGEIQCLGLGMAVDVFDEAGEPVRGRKGELVCTRPFPSMPIGFWNDPGDARYRAAYFERYPGVWAHGDFAEITRHGGMIIHGRSDATLNPGGVRIGTAEIYRQVDKIDAVTDSVVIGQPWDDDVRVVLFVVLRDGAVLDDALAGRIRTQIRTGASPRHVPAVILQVDDIPRTKSGKITELAVRDAVEGREIGNESALANPQSLAQFRGRPELAR